MVLFHLPHPLLLYILRLSPPSNQNPRTTQTRDMAMKRNGKAPVSSDSDEKVVFFNDVSLGPHESQLRFRLIHFWEARNQVKKTVIGLEMLIIDE